MDELTFLARRVRADHVLAAALKEMGWSTTKLGALKGNDTEVLDAVVLSVEKRYPDYKVNSSEFENLVEAAEEASCAIWARHGEIRDTDLALASMKAKAERKLAERRRFREEEIGRKAQRKGTAVRSRWPTRATMLKSAAGDDRYQREMIESDERKRWLKELEKQVRQASTWEIVGTDQGLLSRRMGKGRRANTLRKHVKTWEHFIRWLLAAYGVKWPEAPYQFADYLLSRAMEPCGPSIPVSAFKTLIFMEHAAEIPKEEQLNTSGAIRNALEEIKLQLESDNPRPRRQAVQLLVTVVAALERKVMEEKAPRFVRGFAWYKLVKVWGAMRFHDTTGVDFGSMSLDGFALVANLTRTKTSGPGKRIMQLKLIIGGKVFLEEPRWLETGWKIWEELSDEAGCRERDFFLTLPEGSLNNSSRRMAGYQAASGMSQAIYKELLCPCTGGWEHLMEVGVGCIWSEHSERVTLRTWAGAAGVPDTVCKMLGRWTPSVDQSYDRSIAAQIVRAQMHVAEFIKQNYNHVDPFGETAVLRKVEEQMVAVGYHREVIAVQREKLESFATVGRPLKRIRWGDGSSRDPIEEPAGSEVVSSSSEDEEGKAMIDAAIKRNTGLVLGDYMVSIVGRAKTRTLHRYGECYRQPGVHYKEYETFGTELPKASEYHRACQVCFPRAVKNAETSDSDGSGSDEEISSSSSESI